MNVDESNKPKIESSAAWGASVGPAQSNFNGTAASEVNCENDSLGIVGREATTQGIALSSALKLPSSAAAVTAPPKDVYAAMDAEKASLVSQLLQGGTLTDAAEAAKRIAELHGKPRHADEVCAMADRLIKNKDKQELVKLAASLIVLGEWKSPASIMLSVGNRLSDEDKRAHIFPINARAVEVLRKIPGGAPLAEAIEGSTSQGVSPWLHACRDISAMEAPRKWRQDEAHPDGRLSLQEIQTALRDNDGRPGRDSQVTAKLFARYQTLRSE